MITLWFGNNALFILSAWLTSTWAPGATAHGYNHYLYRVNVCLQRYKWRRLSCALLVAEKEGAWGTGKEFEALEKANIAKTQLDVLLQSAAGNSKVAPAPATKSKRTQNIEAEILMRPGPRPLFFWPRAWWIRSLWLWRGHGREVGWHRQLQHKELIPSACYEGWQQDPSGQRQPRNDTDCKQPHLCFTAVRRQALAWILRQMLLYPTASASDTTKCRIAHYEESTPVYNRHTKLTNKECTLS